MRMAGRECCGLRAGGGDRRGKREEPQNKRVACVGAERGVGRFILGETDANITQDSAARSRPDVGRGRKRTLGHLIRPAVHHAWAVARPALS